MGERLKLELGEQSAPCSSQRLKRFGVVDHSDSRHRVARLHAWARRPPLDHTISYVSPKLSVLTIPKSPGPYCTR